MEFSAHAAAQGGINGLMLPHARHPGEGGRCHLCGIVISVTRQICDLNGRIWKCSADHRFDIGGSHRHGLFRFHQLATGFNSLIGQCLADFLIARLHAGRREVAEQLADDIFIPGFFKIGLND